MNHRTAKTLCGRGVRRAGAALAVAFIAAAVLGGGPAAHAGFTITPTFDPSVTSAEKAVINSAIADYESTYANNMNVNIYFNTMNSGLGQSLTTNWHIAYADFYNGLQANQMISGQQDQLTALNHLSSGPNNPVDGTTIITVKSADGRALGLNTAGNVTGPDGNKYDSIIQFNTNLTAPPQTPGGSTYNLLSVIEHEVDEALGLGSDVGGSGFFSTPTAEDLYRFEKNSTTRSYTTAGDNAWFSIDGGTTSLVQFNQDGNGDYGDWHYLSQPVRVQDAYGTAGPPPATTILNDGGAELTALDVVGYIRAVPEPSTLWLMGIGAIGLSGCGWSRRRRPDGAKVA